MHFNKNHIPRQIFWVLRTALLLICFFPIRVFFRRVTGHRGREGTIFYSALPLPPADEHWDIYLQLCMWDDYHIFLIALLVFTKLLLDEIYQLIELPLEWLIDWWCNVCLFTWWIDTIGSFYSSLTLETSGFELASTIALILQANQLTNWMSLA